MTSFPRGLVWAIPQKLPPGVMMTRHSSGPPLTTGRRRLRTSTGSGGPNGIGMIPAPRSRTRSYELRYDDGGSERSDLTHPRPESPRKARSHHLTERETGKSYGYCPAFWRRHPRPDPCSPSVLKSGHFQRIGLPLTRPSTSPTNASQPGSVIRLPTPPASPPAPASVLRGQRSSLPGRPDPLPQPPSPPPPWPSPLRATVSNAAASTKLIPPPTFTPAPATIPAAPSAIPASTRPIPASPSVIHTAPTLHLNRPHTHHPPRSDTSHPPPSKRSRPHLHPNCPPIHTSSRAPPPAWHALRISSHCRR